MNYASFWTRFGAAFIDGIIVNILASIFGFVVGLMVGVASGPSGNAEAAATNAKILGGILGGVIGWLYSAYLESSPKQATLGKQALNIVVTDLGGNRISFGRATARHFSKYISMIILLIGYIMAAFTEKKQALHDMIAGTLVVTK